MNVMALSIVIRLTRVIKPKVTDRTIVITSAWAALSVMAQIKKIIPAYCAKLKHAPRDSRRPPQWGELEARKWLHFMLESEMVESMVAVLDSLVAPRIFPITSRSSTSGMPFLFVFVFYSVRHGVFETKLASWLILRQHAGGLDCR